MRELRLVGAAGAVAAMLGMTAVPAAAQSLIDALAAAYNTNPDLGAQRARLRATDELVAQALSNWRPQVRLQGDIGKQYFDNSVRPAPVTLEPRSATIQIVQPLYRGGRTVAQTRQANEEVLAERATLVQREQQVLLDAISAYSNLVRDDVVVKLRASNVNVLRQQLTATEARFRVGELTRTDVSQAESRLAGAQADLIRSEADLNISRATFRKIIGLAPGALVDVKAFGTLPKTEEEVIAQAGDANPAVRAAFHRELSARHQVDLVFGELLPTVQIVGTARRAYDVSFEKDKQDSVAVIGQVSIPLYQGGAEYSRVRQAKQIVGQRMLELDSTRRLTVEAAVRAWRIWESSKARTDSIAAQVRAAEIALQGVREEAQVGSRTVLDVLNQEQEVLNAKVELVRAQNELIVAHFGILAVIGRLTARELKLPVEYYDEQAYYNANSGRWIGLGDSLPSR